MTVEDYRVTVQGIYRLDTTIGRVCAEMETSYLKMLLATNFDKLSVAHVKVIATNFITLMDDSVSLFKAIQAVILLESLIDYLLFSDPRQAYFVPKFDDWQSRDHLDYDMTMRDFLLEKTEHGAMIDYLNGGSCFTCDSAGRPNECNHGLTLINILRNTTDDVKLINDYAADDEDVDHIYAGSWNILDFDRLEFELVT